MDMKIYRVGSRPSVKGPEDHFTGNVRIDPLFDPTEPARTSAALVTFEPGARSDWHTHPFGAAFDHHRRLWLDTVLGWAKERDKGG